MGRIVFIAHALQAWALFCPQSPDALFAAQDTAMALLSHFAIPPLPFLETGSDLFCSVCESASCLVRSIVQQLHPLSRVQTQAGKKRPMTEELPARKKCSCLPEDVTRCYKNTHTHTVNKSYVKALCKTHQDSVSGLAIGVMAVYDSVTVWLR